MNDTFHVLLFCHDAEYGRAAMAAGCAGLVVDWEWDGKEHRQSGVDTEINRGTPELLANMRGAYTGRLVCRINNLPGRRRSEAQQAMDLGADEIWLPMVRDLQEVEECLDVLDGGARLSVQVETVPGLRLGAALQVLDLERVYVGLNDLLIDRGRTGHLFSPLVDGTVDTFRQTYDGTFGVAGVTDPRQGAPVSQALLLGAMARLGCSFGIARRSFRRDVPIEQISTMLPRIRHTYEFLQRRTTAMVATDHEALIQRVREVELEARAS